MIEPTRKSSKDENIPKLTLPNGLQAGIINLDGILKEVADLNLTNHKEIQVELLARVKVSNFVPSAIEKEYAYALLEEYQSKYDNSEKVERKIKKKTHAG